MVFQWHRWSLAWFSVSIRHCFHASLSKLSVSSPVHWSVNRCQGFPGGSVPDTDCVAGADIWLIGKRRHFQAASKLAQGSLQHNQMGLRSRWWGHFCWQALFFFALQISLCWLLQCQWLLLGTRAMFWQRLSGASGSCRSYGCSAWTGGAAPGNF